MNSPAFNYIRNQYLLGKFSDEDLEVLVQRTYLTEQEKIEIIDIK